MSPAWRPSQDLPRCARHLRRWCLSYGGWGVGVSESQLTLPFRVWGFGFKYLGFIWLRTYKGLHLYGALGKGTGFGVLCRVEGLGCRSFWPKTNLAIRGERRLPLIQITLLTCSHTPEIRSYKKNTEIWALKHNTASSAWNSKSSQECSSPKEPPRKPCTPNPPKYLFLLKRGCLNKSYHYLWGNP